MDGRSEFSSLSFLSFFSKLNVPPFDSDLILSAGLNPKSPTYLLFTATSVAVPITSSSRYRRSFSGMNIH